MHSTRLNILTTITLIFTLAHCTLSVSALNESSVQICDQIRFQRVVKDLFGPMIHIPTSLCETIITQNGTSTKFEDVLQQLRESEDSGCLEARGGPCPLPNEKYIKIYRSPVESNCALKNVINISVLLTIPSVEKLASPEYDNQFRFPSTYYLMALWYWYSENTNITIGGVNYCVNLTVFSAGYTNDSVIQTAKDIINNNNPQVVVGPWSSGLTSSIVQLFEDAQIPFFGFASTPSIFDCTIDNKTICKDEKSRYKYAWSLLNSGTNYYDSVINTASIKGLKKLFIWSSNELFTTTAAIGAEASANRSNLNVTRVIMNTTEEMDDVISNISAFDPDIVLFIPRHVSACIDFVKRLNASGFAPQILASYNCIEDQKAIDDLGDKLDNVVDIFAYHENSPTRSPKLEGFFKGFEEMFNIPPDHLISARVHDIMNTIFAGYKEAGNLDTANFITALKKIKYDGITGSKQFDANHMNIFVEAKSGQMVGNKIELISPQETATHDIMIRLKNPETLLLPNNEHAPSIIVLFTLVGVIVVGTSSWCACTTQKRKLFPIWVSLVGIVIVLLATLLQAYSSTSGYDSVKCKLSIVGINWGLMIYLFSCILFLTKSINWKILSEIICIGFLPLVIELIATIYLLVSKDDEYLSCTLSMNLVNVVLSTIEKCLIVIYIGYMVYRKIHDKTNLMKKLKRVAAIPLINIMIVINFIIMDITSDYSAKLFITAVSLFVSFLLMSLASKTLNTTNKIKDTPNNNDKVKVKDTNMHESTNSSETASSMPSSSSSETASSMPSDSSETASSMPDASECAGQTKKQYLKEVIITPKSTETQ